MKNRRLGTSRLFHTVVVIGASMGCGLEVAPATDAGSVADGPTVVDTGASVESGLAVDARAEVNEGGPQSVCDCPEPGQFVCAACAGGDTPVKGHCPLEDGVDCRCDPTVPFAGPDQCANPAYYTCALTPDAGNPESTVYDWFLYADCWCDTTRPTTEAYCASLDAGVVLTCTQTSCYTALGRLNFDCSCLPPPLSIR